MHRLALVALAACSHAPPASRPAPPVTEAEIVAKSHAVLDAYDRSDRAAIEAALAPSFVKFENQHLQDRAALLEGIHGPITQPEMTRAWTEDHVYLGGDDAVFIGKATEHETGNDSHGNREYAGWYTLAWVRDHGMWRVAHWAWQPHRTSVENAREMWNETYRQARGFNHEPNRLLVETVRGVTPGAALDVMMGQGRNALYLASQGWKVTGFDIADEGLRLAREAAAQQHLALEAVQADADHYDFGVARWDLITMIYAGSSTKMIERLKPSLKPGGRFVLEFFANIPGESGGFKPGQLAALFGPEFEIQRDDVVDDVPDWAKDRAKLVRFVVRKK